MSVRAIGLRWIGILAALAAATQGLSLSPPAARGPAASPVARAAPFRQIPGEKEFSGRLIVRPWQPDDLARQGLSMAEAAVRIVQARTMVQRYHVREYVSTTDEYILEVGTPGRDDLAAARELIASGLYQYVEPDWIVYPVACPNDSRFGSQWHHQANRMNSCAGWDITTGDPAISVGICDTGVLTTHEDLQLHRLEGYNAVDRLWESQGGQVGPVHPHGTETTGCAAANGNNGIGVAGVGWNLSHRMLRVTNSSSGNAFLSDLTHAARTAIESGDRVASVSYSGVDSNSVLTTGTYIKSIGGLLVWAAGNDGRRLTFSNRDSDDVIVVGATDSGDSLAWFSAYGPMVDVTAPGTSILTTDGNGNNRYAAVSGTSFATPLTAGLCALIWSADPTLTPDQVESILKQGVDDLGPTGADDTYGYGRIDVFGSLSLVGGGGGGGGGGTPPVANFTASPTSGTAPLTVQFTDTSTGNPTSWSWDFGDGGTSTAQNPTHTYQNAGTYTVRLTVSNADGSDTLVRTNYITVSSGGGFTGEGFILSKNPDFSTDDRVFSRNDTIYMLVWSDRIDYTNMRKAEWELRDPNKRKIKQPLTNNNDGSFTASFNLANLPSNATTWTWKGKIEDNNRNKYNPTTTITITTGPTPPTADFVGSPTSGTAPLTVQFTDQSTGNPTSWSWDFGDGGTSTAQNPSHTYASPGTYTVSLTVSNSAGSDTLVRTGYITVRAPGNPPVADFVGSPTSGTAPLSVQFTDQSTGNPTSWSWDFGDGGTSTAQNPTHVYQNPGTYTVTLTVSNADGSDTLVRTNYITVNPGGGFSGEGFILSKNPDFSTDDRVFSRTDTIYILIWSDRVDYTNMRKAEWELRDPNKRKVKQPLTNNNDGSFVASFNLANLPSNATTWTFKGKIEDQNRNKYNPRTTITVLP